MYLLSDRKIPDRVLMKKYHAVPNDLQKYDFRKEFSNFETKNHKKKEPLVRFGIVKIVQKSAIG